MDDEGQLYPLPSTHRVLRPDLQERIGKALQQPDAITLIQALDDVQNLRITDFTDRVVILLDDARDPVRMAAIRALDALDARQTADRLLPLVRPPSDTPTGRQIEQVQRVDRVLGRWQSEDAVATWVRRVRSQRGPVVLQRSAAQALGAAGYGHAAVVETLSAAVKDPSRAASIRIAAAESLGQLKQAGLEPVVAAVQDKGTLGAVLGVRMLVQHDSPESREQLHALAAHSEATVQHAAMRRLQAIDPQLIWRYRQMIRESSDPKVRLVNVEALALRKDVSSIALLIHATDDHHPPVRTTARASLLALSAEPSLFIPVRDALRDVLDKGTAQTRSRRPTNWRSVEQAAMLLGVLDDKDSAQTLMTLTAYPRLEPRLAAVGAVRQLAVPETRSQMVALMQSLMQRVRAGAPGVHYVDAGREPDEADRLTHENAVSYEVAQTLGAWRVQEAVPMFRRLIPKHPPPNLRPEGSGPVRSAAIWALGQIYENDVHDEIAAELADRMADYNPLDPEYEEVRRQSMITIARMRAVDYIPNLKYRYGFTEDPMNLRGAGKWAYEQLTGETLEALAYSLRSEVSPYWAPIQPKD